MIIKRFKQLSLILIIITVLMGVCGCMKKDATFSSDEIVDIYNRKYDDMFSFVSSGNEVWSAKYQEVKLLSKNLKDKIITVWIYEDGYMVDNYIPLKYQEEVELSVKNIASEIYGDVKVINVPVSYGNSSFSPQTTFNEYISSELSYLKTAILVEKITDTKDEDIEKLRVSLEQNNILSEILVYYFDDCKIDEVVVLDHTYLVFSPNPSMSLKLALNEDYTVDILN